MFHSLKFELEFKAGKASGKKFQGLYPLQQGLTGFFGKNEAGKSLRFEMLRYALWGSKALRGSTSDYKSLSVEVIFEVKGKLYRVERGLKECRLHVEDAVLADGTKPVNAAIRNLFGYGMEVFDMANASLQDETQAITNMKPAERKRMIDQVVGLDALDKMDERYKQQAAALTQNLKALQSVKRDIGPEPSSPTGYTADQLAAQIEPLKVKVNRFIELNAQDKALYCDVPKKEGRYGVPGLDELYKMQAEETAQKTNLKSIEAKLANLRVVTSDLDAETYKSYVEILSTDLFDRLEARQQWSQRVSRLPPKPKQSEQELKAIIASMQKQQAQARADQLRADSCVTCPHCTKDFSLQQDKIDQITAPHAASMIVPHQDFISEAHVNRALSDLYEVDSFYANNPEPEECLDPGVSRADMVKAVALYERARAYEQERDLLLEEKEQYEGVTFNDYEPMIKQAKANVEAAERERAAEAAYAKYQEFLKANGEELESLRAAPLLTEIEQLTCDWKNTVAYESAVKAWKEENARQCDIECSIAELNIAAERLATIRKTLSELKPKIKSYLMPSLNSVASNLLSQMTNGERNFVYIDEEFDILIDGQRVETLSGSGKAVANLAIRIALGTVLTNRVFSVFMADEVDAAMRDERATYTAGCLKNLAGTIRQILIISHKDIEVDQKIDV